MPRLSLVAELPTLLVWGARDRIIPLRHGIAAARYWELPTGYTGRLKRAIPALGAADEE